jgi:hypothetical protein
MSTAGGGDPVTAALARELLVTCAAARECVADEHMFTVTHGGILVGTFRLQLFTAPGVRPVAIATQSTGEGDSLARRSAEYAAAVWHRRLPDAARPPVWIELQLRAGRPDLLEDQPARFELVTFAAARPYRLGRPQRCPVSDQDVIRLVGGQVDRDRGDWYLPWPAVPADQPACQLAWVGLLPAPVDVDRGCFTGAPPWWRRLGRQLVPCRRTRTCCYYHGVDWRRVSAAAIRIARQIRAEGRAGDAHTSRAYDLAAEADLPQPEREALAELLAGPSAIRVGRDDQGRRYYLNGRHRAGAMLDAGVRRTVVFGGEKPPGRTQLRCAMRALSASDPYRRSRTRVTRAQSVRLWIELVCSRTNGVFRQARARSHSTSMGSSRTLPTLAS